MKKKDITQQKKQDWQKKQEYLFSLIKSQVPVKLGFIDELETVLGIDKDAVYRRISGKTKLKFNELCTLCDKFEFSMDEIMGYNSGRQSVAFNYLTINPAFTDSYKQYLQQLYKMLAKLSQSVDAEFFFTAAEIPLYYFPDYPELLYFKLYERYKILNNLDICYNDFCEQLDKDSIMPHYKHTIEMCMQLPSSEIWGEQTISGMLQSLEYCTGTKCFEDRETVLLLLEQLSKLISTVEKNAASKSRGNKQSPFNLYINHANIVSNIILIRNGDKFDCDIRLFTANSLLTSDEPLCSDVRKYIDDMILKSVLVSGRLEYERCEFFQTMHDKITGLISEIQQIMH
jgi:hypothetical protein